MHLEYLPANQAWVWMFGDRFVPMGSSELFFENKTAALRAAQAVGISRLDPALGHNGTTLSQDFDKVAVR